jgi:hypothetical protein
MIDSFDDLRKIASLAVAYLRQQLDAEKTFATTEEIAEAIGASEHDVEKALDATQCVVFKSENGWYAFRSGTMISMDDRHAYK